MSRFFDLTTVAGGIAIGMIVAGALAIVGGSYAQGRRPRPAHAAADLLLDDASALPANLGRYAGEQVDTAEEAKAFADGYIGLHLQETADGQTYSEVSGRFMQDPTNEELAQQRMTHAA